MDTFNLVITIFLVGFLYFCEMADAIDCFKCSSIDQSNQLCEDKFEVNMSTVHFIERSCVYGHFKGIYCIKFKGEKEDGTKITVRDCSDKDWGSHCGGIRYFTGDQEQMVYGCLEACAHDGCNGASAQSPLPPLITILALYAVVTLTWRNLWRTMTS